MMLKFFILFLITSKIHGLKKIPVDFTLGELGEITGVESQTKKYENAPFSERTTYVFRGIPYAHPVIDQDRFKQSSLKTDPLTNDGSKFDATRDGPLCQQGSTSSLSIENLKSSTLKELISDLFPEIIDLLPGELVDTFLGAITKILEILFELEDGFLDFNKPISDILHEWLDIELGVDEDCLHLSVSTPWKPTGVDNKTMPVMFFIHGGAFAFGTQIRMGGERLQAWSNVVVVAINYRVGPLGFLCLDTDEAAGNMGMLDMVVALEWVHQYIGYFGGDPNQITIFGESAGSASIGHLVLSPSTNGLFSKGIGQSGGAVATWAFDKDAEYNAKMVAETSGCPPTDDHDAIVQCLRNMPALNVSVAYSEWSKMQRKDGLDGFGGTTPCMQTKGARKFYAEGETPDDILYNGNYTAVPIMFGANSHEGSYVYGAVYNDFMVPNNLTNDYDFLKYDMIHTLMKTVGVTNSYAVEYMIEHEYFEEWMMGNLDDMQPGLIDLLSVFFLKASSYEFMAQNSEYEDSYWYAFDYKTPQKSVFHMLFPNTPQKAEVKDIGVCHADELMYIFDMELPVLLCDVPQLLTDFTQDLTECLLPENLLPEDLASCIMERPNYIKWHNCLLGELTPEELNVSATLAQMWTNFATTGNPELGAVPWKSKEPKYLKITDKLELVEDYRREYHIASEQAATDPPSVSSSTSSSSSSTSTTSSSTMTPTTSGANSFSSEIIIFVGLLIFCIQHY